MRTFSTICSLSELDQDNPVGESGRQEGGDEASVHGEEPTCGDMGPALQSSDQNLGRGNLRRIFVHDLFVVFFLRWRLFILKSCYDVLCIFCVPVENFTKSRESTTWHLCQVVDIDQVPGACVRK